MVKVVAFLLASATADQFDDWKAQFGKEYNTDESDRRAIFESNLELIATENAKGHTYTLGLGPFTDLTSEEYRANLGFVAPADTDLPTFVTEDLAEDEELADSLDWTTKGAVTPVKNQGQCGSCWAFSTTGALEGAYQVASGKLVSLSEQQYVDCDGFPNMGCNGGNMAFGLRYAKDHNICTEESYQYKGKGGACQAASCTTGLKSGTVTAVTKVGGLIGQASDNALKTALNKQPISIGIEADQPAFQHYVGGVVTGTCGAKVDHGVLLVGYGTDGSTPYWKVKNSWGASWGDHGFVRMVQGKNECGINSQPNYPVIKSSVSV